MKKFLLSLMITLLCVLNITQFIIYNYSHTLPKEAVPNEDVAVQIAEIVLVPIYGEDVLLNKPFEVFYDKSKKAWIVNGTLPEGYLGGVPEIVIRKKDGKIIKITHSF